MNVKQAAFLGLIFATGTTISLTFGGAWIGQSELDVVNTLTVFRQASVLGMWSITVPNLSFVTTGLRAMTMFDFAFFSGTAQFFQWFILSILGFAIGWGLFTVMIVVFSSLFRRRA